MKKQDILMQKHLPVAQRRGTLSAKNAACAISLAKKVSTFDTCAGEGAGQFYEKEVKFGADAKHGYLSKTKRNLYGKKDKTPGVGQYDIQKEKYTRSKSPSYKFNAHKEKGIFDDAMSNTQIEVGPGAYNTLDTASTTSNKLMKGGVIARDKKWKHKVNTNPGPGFYQPNRNAVEAESRGMSIGRASVCDSYNGSNSANNWYLRTNSALDDFVKKSQSKRLYSASRGGRNTSNVKNAFKSINEPATPNPFHPSADIAKSMELKKMNSINAPGLKRLADGSRITGSRNGTSLFGGFSQLSGRPKSVQLVRSCSLMEPMQQIILGRRPVLPGPGQYNPFTAVTRSHSIAFTMPKAHTAVRLQKLKKDGISSGDYQQDTFKYKAIKAPSGRSERFADKVADQQKQMNRSVNKLTTYSAKNANEKKEIKNKNLVRPTAPKSTRGDEKPKVKGNTTQRGGQVPNFMRPTTSRMKKVQINKVNQKQWKSGSGRTSNDQNE